MGEAKILIGGDFVLDDTMHNTVWVDQSVKHLFSDSDYNILNLEAPVTYDIPSNKIIKTGPHLRCSKDVVQKYLRQLNINLVTLANNHILDYGRQGLVDTLKFCAETGIQKVGAGLNLTEASKFFRKEIRGNSISIVNFAENEWSNATESSPGANPMDIINNVRQIKEAKRGADFVVVIVHGGNEYNHYPSPRMVKQYRFYAECGADAVIGHHTHCVSGYETHQGVPIFYSLGNFLFTTKKNKLDSWYSGLVVQLLFQKGRNINFEVIPVSLSTVDQTLSVAKGEAKNHVLGVIEEVNKAIANGELLHEKWLEFLKRAQGGFVKSISPLAAIENVYVRAALYRLRVHRLFLNKTYLKEHLNRIRCEAHYDVVKDSLKHYLELYKGK